ECLIHIFGNLIQLIFPELIYSHVYSLLTGAHAAFFSIYTVMVNPLRYKPAERYFDRFNVFPVVYLPFNNQFCKFWIFFIPNARPTYIFIFTSNGIFTNIVTVHVIRFLLCAAVANCHLIAVLDNFIVRIYKLSKLFNNAITFF